MIRITASEAIYGFAAWLTTRKKTITLGGNSDCATIVPLITEWCKVNKLPQPRAKVFAKNITHPKR